MHDTLASLVDRAVMGTYRPLEFYLREHSRLPGPRANLELVNDVSYLLATAVSAHPETVRSLLDYFANGNRKVVLSNTPAEFVMLCGIVSYGACAAVHVPWRAEVRELLKHYARSSYWRIREAVTIAYQRLLVTDTHETLLYLTALVKEGGVLQQRAAIASVAESAVLVSSETVAAALAIQRIALERLHQIVPQDRKNEDFRILKRSLGYTLSVVTATNPEEGFALMRTCATWGDADITWILRENLKKKRLAKFVEDTEGVSQLLA